MRRLFILLALMISATILTAQTRWLIYMLNFTGFPATFEEIGLYCQGKGVGVERAYNPKQLAAVRSALEKLLDEKGQPGIVNVEIRRHEPDLLDVTFSVVTP